MPLTAARRMLAGAAVLAGLALLAHPAFAQAHNPFGVGISEGGGAPSGWAGWLMREQAGFERQLAAAVRAVRTDRSAAFGLMALSFAYGVFHAAGPGHGKAVITSYLVANERALRRGLVLSGLAALLQGVVAVAIVGVLALVLHATAQRMKDAASLVESLSYAGVAGLGAWLVLRKGRLLLLALRRGVAAGSLVPVALAPSSRLRPAAAFAGAPCDDCGHDLRYAAAAAAHDPGCGHAHAPDPATLGEGFSWREAALTVAVAGARPCSGAILVLVFAMAQGLFTTGVLAVLAMSVGTAVTTGALAALAVLARGLALRLVPTRSPGGLVLLRAGETAAAAVILAIGLVLLAGATAGPA